MKDDKKYSDLVDVLDQVEDRVHEMYVKSGLCAPPDAVNRPPGHPIAAPARPDQPVSHVPFPCFGDQNTKVSLAYTKDFKAGSHTPHDRLDHLYLFRIVDWHS